MDAIATLLKSWMNIEWFHCPLHFQRTAARVKAGPIEFGELPRRIGSSLTGVFFTYRGYVSAYPERHNNFVHVDTRGITIGTRLPGE